jgi:bacterioferritin-associated ferredoxin
MPKSFVFAKDVQKLVNQGEKRIEVLEGARFSAAALDLIRDYQVEVVRVRGSGAQAVPSVQVEGTSTEREKSAPVAASPSEGKSDVISEEDIEEIVTRVIDRFRELRGKGTQSSTPDQKKRGVEGKPESADDVVICRCEEITRGEIKEVIRTGIKTLSGVKRVTRAGMGLCQGQTCERLVSQIIASELGLAPEDMESTTARAPLRPIPLSVFAKG